MKAKKLLSFLLTLVMLVSLFPAASLAEEPEELAPEFLLQPQSGSVPVGEDYLVTWALEPIPDRLELVKEDPRAAEGVGPYEDDEQPALIPVRELDPASTELSLAAPEEETVWRIRAFYGEEELISDAFTVTLLPAEEPAEEPAPAEEPRAAEGVGPYDETEEPAEEPAPAEEPEEPAEPVGVDVPGDPDGPEAVPAPADEPEADDTVAMVTYIWVYDDQGNVTGGYGGTVSYSPAKPKCGELVHIIASPAPGYQVQGAEWGNGVLMGLDVTDTMSFIVPEGWQSVEVDVGFSPEGSSLPIPYLNTLNVEGPLAGGSYSSDPLPAKVTNVAGQRYELISARWLGGTGSGCVGQAPNTFKAGASYTVEIVLAPRPNWHFSEGASGLVAFKSPYNPDFSSTTYLGYQSSEIDSQGYLHLLSEEIQAKAWNINLLELDIQMFEEGDYPEGCPVVFNLPEDPRFSISNAVWYNDANQASGGIGLGATSILADGVYFTEFTVTADENYSFPEDCELRLNIGSVKYKEVRDSGRQLFVCTGPIAIDEAAAAQYRRVFVYNYTVDSESYFQNDVVGGQTFVSDYRPKVGDSVTVNCVPKPGYRLQQLRLSHDPEIMGASITEELCFTVDEDERDIYIDAYYAPADAPVHALNVGIGAKTPDPCPLGSYSYVDFGGAPAELEGSGLGVVYTVNSAFWQMLGDYGYPVPATGFVPGRSYRVQIVLQANENWTLDEQTRFYIYFTGGGFFDTDNGSLTRTVLADGSIQLTTDYIDYEEAVITELHYAISYPRFYNTYDSGVFVSLTDLQENHAALYQGSNWINAVDQETGAAGTVPTQVMPGCQYYAAIYLTPADGWRFDSDELPEVELMNAEVKSISVQGSAPQILTVKTNVFTFTDEIYSITGSFISAFSANGQITAARVGDYVYVTPDYEGLPEGKYVASISSADLEPGALRLYGDSVYQFVMPDHHVLFEAELRDRETYVIDLTEGSATVPVEIAIQVFPGAPTGSTFTRDLNEDGTDDLLFTYLEDGSILIERQRACSAYGDISEEAAPGRIGTLIYRMGPEFYRLYLGSVPVTAANKDDIPVAGGHASYDPATNTLTLENVTGVIGATTVHDLEPLKHPYQIEALGDLNIVGSATLVDQNYAGVIYVAGNLSMDGDFELKNIVYNGTPPLMFAGLSVISVGGNFDFTGSLTCDNFISNEDESYAPCCGIVVGGNMNVGKSGAPGSIYFGGRYGAATVKTGGDLKLTVGSLRVENLASRVSSYALYCTGKFTVVGEFYGYSEIDCVRAGSFQLISGYVYARSRQEKAFVVSGQARFDGGVLYADSDPDDGQAIQVGSFLTTSSISILYPSDGAYSSDRTTIVHSGSTSPVNTAAIGNGRALLTVKVKDLDGNVGVGGTVSLDNSSFSTSVTAHANYGDYDSFTIYQKASEGYLFDHWEDAYGENLGDNESWSTLVQEDRTLYAVFEELLPINAANFPDANFRAYISERFDLDSDGYLSRAEREAVTSISVNGKSVASLVGIKYFPELKSLYAYNNNLTELDVRNNPKLEYLRCDGNSSLSRLYVAGCAKLETLWCYKCKLTSISLAGCTALKTLDCYNNNLSHLELGMCRDLEYLRCDGNSNLASLAVNSNKLRYLVCYGTKLDTLDLSGCAMMVEVCSDGVFTQYSSYDDYTMEGASPTWRLRCNKGAVVEEDMGIQVNRINFPDDDFRQYGASSFDLNKNGWLSPAEIAQANSLCIEEWADMHNVQGIHFLTELTFIMIDGNPNLTELDLSQNTKLTGLEIYDNSLTTLILGQQPALESIYADHNAFTTVDLSGAPNLKYLDIASNPLTSIDLSATPDLKELYIFGTELAELDLSGNPILLDAYLNGTRTEQAQYGYVEYSGGSLGGRLLIDPDQEVVTEATSDHVPGDINGDGMVNNKDVIRLQKYLKDSSTTVNAAALDVNGDGKVNNKDLIRLTRWLKYHDVEIH